jgi:glucose 1-dehydrogenase
MFDRLRAEFGTLDILVANAGLQQDAPIAEMTLAQWNKVFLVNLTGAILVRAGGHPRISPPWCAARYLLRGGEDHLHELGASGDLVGRTRQLCCLEGRSGAHERHLAQEVAAERIRVNAIAPGAIRTPINKSAWETKEAAERLLMLIPYGRIGEPEDVARVAVWLASDESDYVVGTTLFVDGGMTPIPDSAPTDSAVIQRSRRVPACCRTAAQQVSDGEPQIMGRIDKGDMREGLGPELPETSLR